MDSSFDVDDDSFFFPKILISFCLSSVYVVNSSLSFYFAVEIVFVVF